MSIELFLETVQKKAWIYKITIGKKVYIGSTVDIKGRKNSHLRELKKNKHANAKLQRAYNKRKEFIWEVLEECNEIDRWKRESFWIIEHNSILEGYNIAPVDMTKDAIKDESLIRTVSDNPDFLLVYEKAKNLLVKYFDAEFTAGASKNVLSSVYFSLKVRANARTDVKIAHWNNELDKMARIIEMWKEIPEGYYRWHDSYFPELSGWKSLSASGKYKCTKRPYEFLTNLFRNVEDPLLVIVIRKLHMDGLLMLENYKKYHQPFYGPPTPEKQKPLKYTSTLRN